MVTLSCHITKRNNREKTKDDPELLFHVVNKYLLKLTCSGAMLGDCCSEASRIVNEALDFKTGYKSETV